MMVKQGMRDDWVDAASDAFQPELYQPMRKMGNQKAPWERGSQLMEVDGLDPEDFRDNEWEQMVARPPIK